MAFPSSSVFSELDWNSRAADTSSATDGFITDLTQGAIQSAKLTNFGLVENILPFDGGMLLRADGSGKISASPETSTYRLGISVPSTFTFEFDFAIPGDLPENFSDQDKRIFVGAVKPTGYTAGFLFSKIGIGVCSSPYSPDQAVVLLQGSSNLLFEKNGTPKTSITLRAAVNADDGRMSIYVTDTAKAYDSDLLYGAHKLAYTIPAVSTTLPDNQILAAIRAKSGVATSYNLHVTSLRLSAGIVNSPSRPVAVIPMVESAIVGRKLRLDARQSYDPDLGILTYHWEIEEAPKGSVAQLKGGVYSSATLGTVGANNGVSISYKKATSAADGITIEVVKNAAAAAPLVISKLDDTKFKISLETNSSGTVLTTASKLVEAFTKINAAGYNQEVSDVLTIKLLAGVTGSGLMVTGFLALDGGSGSNLDVTSVQIDKAGLWRFSLVANNGFRDSDPVILSVHTTLDDQLLRHRPKSDYIFKSLSDFWNLVEGKEQAAVAWSAVSQVIGVDLLKALQNDYSKSIRDISRKYQRRWLSYPMRIEIPSSLDDSLVYTCGASYFIKPDISTAGGGSNNASTALNTRVCTLYDPRTSGTPIINVVPEISDKAIVVDSSGGVVKTAIQTYTAATAGLTLGSDAVTAFKLIDSGSNGFGLLDPAGVLGVTQTKYLSEKGKRISTQKILAGDILVMNYNGSVLARTVVSSSPVNTVAGAVIDNTIEFSSGQGMIVPNGVRFSWQIMRPSSYSQIFQFPYFDLGLNVDIQHLAIGFGDAVEITYVDPSTDEELTTQLPLLHVTSNEVFPDWRPFIRDLNIVAKSQSSDPLNLQEITLANSHELFGSIRIKTLIRTRRVPVGEDVVSIPFLGRTVNPEFMENRDFSISAGFVNLSATNTLTVTPQGGTGFVTVHPVIADTSKVKNLLITSGEIGNYAVVDADPYGAWLELAYTFSSSAQMAAETNYYSFNNEVPENLWAEVTFFDNHEIIENNFGLLVGLPKSIVESGGVDLDYLTIVRSLWFAFVSGPSIATLELAANAFMGLPYSEIAGNVTVFNDSETESLGRIVVKEIGKPGYRTYYYPNTYLPAINPSTGRTIKAMSLDLYNSKYLSGTAQKSLQSLIDNIATPADKKVVYQKKLADAQDADDSRIPAFTTLVEAVRVYDYVSAPESIAQLLAGEDELTKFHTFVVQIPTAGLNSLDFLPLLKSFVDEWKPAHTAVKFFGISPIIDQISVVENLQPVLTYKMQDSVYTERYVSGTNSRIWPSDSCLDNTSAGDTWVVGDVTEKYESGYVSGVLDDYSGDGSWNSSHKVVDMVNSLDGDVDVLESQIWVPITKDTGTAEFAIGEELELLVSGVVQTGLGWDASSVKADNSAGTAGAAPVVAHVGSGIHPKISFGTYSPQNAHASSYLLLSFYSASGAINYGTTERLRALQKLDGNAVVVIRGKTTGAQATVVPISGTTYHNFDIATDVDHTDYLWHKSVFHLDYVFRLDKLEDLGPKQAVTVETSMYIPVGGTWPVQEADLETSTAFVSTDLELQNRPYLSMLSDESQSSPSYSPGFFVSYGAPHSLDFVGSSSPGNIKFLAALNHSSLEVDAATCPAGVSIEAWVKPSLDEIGYIFSRSQLGSTNFSLGFDTTGGSIKVIFYGNNQAHITTGTAYPASTWLHVFVTYSNVDAGGGVYPIEVYINNVNQPISAVAPSVVAGAAPLPMQAGEHLLFGTFSGGSGGITFTPTNALYTGAMHSITFWNALLDGANRAKLAAEPTNSLVNVGDYNSSANVIHAWWMGNGEGDVDPTSVGVGYIAIVDRVQLSTSLVPGAAQVPTISVSYPFLGTWLIGPRKLTWGFKDKGDLAGSAPPTPWVYPEEATAIQNLHIGRRVMSSKGYHKTHGFTEFYIPPPRVRKATLTGGTVRIEGFFLTADDPTRTLAPTSSTFDGANCGSWVFFKRNGVETPVTAIVFETGLNVGKTVLGIDGSVQTSTGHVLEVPVPIGLAAGTYDIIVRNYRKYKLAAGDSPSLHIDTSTLASAIVIV